MRFEEKIAEGSVAKFAVMFGERHFQSAALAAGVFGVRDVFLFSDPERDKYRVSLQYLNYESFDFRDLDRSMNPPWTRGWNLNKWPAEQVARLDAERRAKLEEVEEKLFAPEISAALELPYRLGPLSFLQANAANDPYSTRLEIGEWSETLRPQLMSVADRGGTQVVFVPEDLAGYVTATAGPGGVQIFRSQEQGAKLIEPVNWADGRINLFSPGNSWRRGFCVCDLQKEQVFWLKYKP